MRTRANIASFFVEAGRSFDFPVDMLRYGECYPTDTASANAIRANLEGEVIDKLQKGEVQRIALSTHQDPFGSAFYQSAKRWESFGWKVRITDEDGEVGPYLLPDGQLALAHPRAKHPVKAA